MEAAGIGADVRRRLFVDNPARAFAFAATRWRARMTDPIAPPAGPIAPGRPPGRAA